MKISELRKQIEESKVFCKDCHWRSAAHNMLCLSGDAPYTDFVEKAKVCKDINIKGGCKYFKEKEK